MSYQPCQNPNCKSYGKPHPNCRCEVAMAEGGEVAPDFIPDDEASKTEEAPDFIPDDKAPEEAPDFIPDEPESNENLSPADLQAKMVSAANPNGPSEYESPTQQAATVAEGLAQGVAGPVATLAETKLLGIDPKDIVGRQEANPWEHGLAEAAGVAGSLATGVGEAGMISKGAEGLTEYARLGKIGSAAVKGLITNGLIQGGDEASKAILGQGNPEDAVSPTMAIGAASLFGGLLGAGGAKLAGAMTGPVSEKAMMKLAAEAEQNLAGIGHAASGGALEEGANKAFKTGYELYKNIPANASKWISSAVGHHFGGETGTLLGYKYGDKVLAPLISKVTNKAGKYAVPATVRWLSEGAQGSLFKMIDYANKVQKGESLINNSIDALFKAGSQQSVNAGKGRDIEKLKEFIDGGGVDQTLQDELYNGNEPQGFAKGGEVGERRGKPNLHQDDHLASTLPEQNLLLQTAKGRVSNYLSSMRPQKNMPKLAFDDDHDDREQKKNYDRALEIAVNPMGVMDRVKAGTIEPDHIRHLNGMYPELTGHLQKKVVEKISKAQVDGKKPSYVVRQGLSLLLGAPLSGEMTPTNIQAAQSVFSNAAKQRASSQDSKKEGAPKKSSSSLSKSDRAYLTDDQARAARQQKV